MTEICAFVAQLPNLRTLFVTLGLDQVQGGPGSVELTVGARLEQLVLRGVGAKNVVLDLINDSESVLKILYLHRSRPDPAWLQLAHSLTELVLWEVDADTLAQILTCCEQLVDLSLDQVLGEARLPRTRLERLFMVDGRKSTELAAGASQSLKRASFNGPFEALILGELSQCPKLAELWLANESLNKWPEDCHANFMGLTRPAIHQSLRELRRHAGAVPRRLSQLEHRLPRPLQARAA